MKKKNKPLTGSVKIDPKVLEDARIVCKETGVKLSFFTTEAVKEKIQRLQAK